MRLVGAFLTKGGLMIWIAYGLGIPAALILAVFVLQVLRSLVNLSEQETTNVDGKAPCPSLLQRS